MSQRNDLVELICNRCGANLEIENGIDIFYCKYCGNRMINNGRNIENVQADVRIREMAHEEAITDRHIEQERYEMEQRQINKEAKRRHDRNMTIIACMTMLACFSMAFGLLFIYRVTDWKETKRLEALLEEIEIEIEDGDYEAAIIKAQSLQFTGESTDEKKRWDDIRKITINIINEAKAKEESIKLRAVPGSASSMKGTNYEDVVRLFQESGFTDITVLPISEKPRLFSSIGDVKEISIDGDKSFKTKSSFPYDSKVIISYYAGA